MLNGVSSIRLCGTYFMRAVVKVIEFMDVRTV